MGRKATDRQGYSKSAGQSWLADAIERLFPLDGAKQDVALRQWVDRELGYPWGILEREHGTSLARLYADVVVTGPPPVLLEYHGRQHFEYVQHFHGDAEGWAAAKERDNQKHWLSQRLGIPLAVFRYDETLDDAGVLARIEEAAAAVMAMEGYAPCPACGRTFLPGDILDGRCPACQRDDRKAAGKARQAAAAAARAIEPRELERQADMKSRADEIRRQRESDPAFLAAKEARKSEERERSAAARKTRQDSPEYQEAKSDRKARDKEREAERKASPEHVEAERSRKERQKQYAEEAKRARAADPSFQEAQASRKAEAKERERAYREEYRQSDAFKAAKEREREYRKGFRSRPKGDAG